MMTVDNEVTAAMRAQEQSEKALDKIFTAAQPGAVFSQPVTTGSYTVITASEVFAGGGFGFGSGTGPVRASAANAPDGLTPDMAGGGGGGGGGGSHGRPIAAVVIGPDGVKVQPIVDATKIALAAVGAWGSIALIAVRLARQT